MVNCYGEWTYEAGTPANEKCDCDLVADYILHELDYQPKTTIENLVEMIISYYEDEISDTGYFAIEENKYGNMINVDDVAEYIAANGISEFDYWC